jgi:hypothetical protein
MHRRRRPATTRPPTPAPAPALTQTNSLPLPPPRLGEQVSLFAFALAAIFTARQLEQIGLCASVGFLLLAVRACAELIVPLVAPLNVESTARRVVGHTCVEVAIVLIVLDLDRVVIARDCRAYGILNSDTERCGVVADNHVDVLWAAAAVIATMFVVKITLMAIMATCDRPAIANIQASGDIVAAYYTMAYGYSLRWYDRLATPSGRALCVGLGFIALAAIVLKLTRVPSAPSAARDASWRGLLRDSARYAAMLGIVAWSNAAEMLAAEHVDGLTTRRRSSGARRWW